VTLRFKGTRLKHSRVSLLDPAHGDVHAAYAKMGSPQYPTPSQVRELKAAAGLAAPEVQDLKNGELTLTLPSYGLALIHLK
jgi:xylan 1,4-beta-xylosidase